MTRLLAIWLILGTLTGCAASPPAPLPDWDIPAAAEDSTQPVPLPPLPLLAEAEGRVFLDRDGILALMAFREAAEANTRIAEQNALALNRQAEAYNALILAGQHTRDIAGIRGEMLAQERAAHRESLLFHRGLLALGALASFMR